MNETERERPNWDTYCMLLAYTAGLRSPDPYTIVGAAAFRKDRSTIATGYNGAPPGVEINWSDRDARRPFVTHAEENCLKYTTPGEPHYLYVTMLPCSNCLRVAMSYGVKEIVYANVYHRDTFTIDNAGEYGIVLRQLSIPYDHFSKYFCSAKSGAKDLYSYHNA
jgi:dCMP deaminase